MKAVILAGGLGVRLCEEIIIKPKLMMGIWEGISRFVKIRYFLRLYLASIQATANF